MGFGCLHFNKSVHPTQRQILTSIYLDRRFECLLASSNRAGYFSSKHPELFDIIFFLLSLHSIWRLVGVQQMLSEGGVSERMNE